MTAPVNDGKMASDGFAGDLWWVQLRPTSRCCCGRGATGTRARSINPR